MEIPHYAGLAQFAACLICNMKGVPVVPLNHPMTLMDLSDPSWFCYWSSGAVRTLHSDLETEQSFGPLPEDQSFCWSPRDQSVTGEDWQDLAHWQDHEIASRSASVERKRFGCRFREECRTQLFMTTLLACLKLQINIRLLSTGKPPKHLQSACCACSALRSLRCGVSGALHICHVLFSFHIGKVPPPTTDNKCYTTTLLPNNDSVVSVYLLCESQSAVRMNMKLIPSAGTSDTDT